MTKTTIEKLESDFMKAKMKYEEAQKALEEKKTAFEIIRKKRNKKICKELETILSNFYNCITHSENFFNAFCEMESLGVDSDELLFQDIDCVLLDEEENKFIVRQIHSVNYNETYEHDTFIPTEISIETIRNIVNIYIEKEKELKIREEKERKQRRYEEYLRLKKEFEEE